MSETVVEIGGHHYRYEYDPESKNTLYRGPVGDAPALSEEEFLAIFGGFKEQEQYYHKFAEALGGKLTFYGDQRSVVHEEDIGRETGGQIEINLSFFEGEKAIIEQDVQLMELVIVQLFDEEEEDMPRRTDIKYETNRDEYVQELTIAASEATTGLYVNPDPEEYAEAVMYRIREDYIPPDERLF